MVVALARVHENFLNGTIGMVETMLFNRPKDRAHLGFPYSRSHPFDVVVDHLRLEWNRECSLSGPLGLWERLGTVSQMPIWFELMKRQRVVNT